jgi:hypothetical protein
VCAEKAKTISGEVIDEATRLLSSVKKILKSIEDSLVSSFIKTTTCLKSV